MRHLIVCPEYPPSPTPPGGIGTYVWHLSRILATAGETVHVVAQQWTGAPESLVETEGGRLAVHRVPVHEVIQSRSGFIDSSRTALDQAALSRSDSTRQMFAWNAAVLIEALVEQAGIDLIEAQDYDAPLYYFQLRRGLGLGPSRKPPCIVHLHSPSEFIVRYNEWDPCFYDFQTAIRMETYSIGAADGLLCPSRFMAKEAASCYGLPPAAIEVIPLPSGDTPWIERTDDVWRTGRVCYLGRLEPRKGVIEWLEAVIAVAGEFPQAEFDLVGANLAYSRDLSVLDVLERRTPDSLRGRVRFLGSRTRAEVFEVLRQSRIAAVPSRWENFPNTCVEQMCSGMPVIVSPSGGMAEMVRDGITGWVARAPDGGSLADALRRALRTPPDRLAEMGRQAGAEIRALCDNARILERHMEYRRRVAARGADRSLRVPANLPWLRQPLAASEATRIAACSRDIGIAYIVIANDTTDPADCLAAVERQTSTPSATVIVTAAPAAAASWRGRAEGFGWIVRELRAGDAAALCSAGLDALSQAAPPLAVVFLSVADRISPRFGEVCEAVFVACPGVGIVQPWVQGVTDAEGNGAGPCPAFPFQWLANEVSPLAVTRLEAIASVGGFRVQLDWQWAFWDLATSVMAAGWAAVTVPEWLAQCPAPGPRSIANRGAFTLGRHQMLARFHQLLARDAPELVHLLEGRMQRWRTGA